MYRVISVAVIAVVCVAVARAVIEILALATSTTEQTGTPPVMAMLLIAALVAFLAWFLVRRSIRAWRNPSRRTVADLYSAFAVIVFLFTYGLGGLAIARRDGATSDFVAFAGPWVLAIVIALAVHLGLRRWGVPEGLAVDDERRPPADR